MSQFTIRGYEERRLLWALLLLALLLRAVMLGWGLPVVNPHARPYHPDEAKIIEAAARFPAHILENTDFRYPTFLHYLVGVVATLIFGPQPGEGGHFWTIYLLGRIVSLFAGVGSVWLVFVHGKRFRGRAVGLLAAALLAFSLYHAQSSAWATTDVMSAFLLLALLFVSRGALEEGGSTRTFVGAGLLFGALVATRYTGLVALPVLGLMYLAARVRAEDRVAGAARRIITDGQLYAFGLAAALAFFVATPGALLHYDMLPEAFRYETARLGRSPFTQFSAEIWLGSLLKMATAFGWPLLVSSLLGLLLTVRRPVGEWGPALLLIGVVFGFGDALLARYLILVAPMTALLAAEGLVALHARRPSWRRRAAIVLALVVVLYSFGYTAAGTYSRLQETRTEAASFLAETVPPGSTVGVAYTAVEYAWEAHAFRYPALDRERLRYVDFLQEPEVLVVSDYDLDPIREALASDRMLPGYEWPEAHDDVWYRGAEPRPKIFRFYDRLLRGASSYCRVAIFSPQVLVPIEFPPPEIQIFARGEAARTLGCEASG